MLRIIFVYCLIAIGAVAALQGPFRAMLFYLWYAYFRPEQWVWSDVVSQLNLSLVLGGYLLFLSIFTIRKFRINAQIFFIILFLIQSVFSLIFTEHFSWCFAYWIEFIKVALITLLLTFLVDTPSRYRAVLLVVGLSLGFESAKQGWAQLILNPGAQNNNAHPALGDNNGVALGMMMLIPVFLSLLQTAKSSWERQLHRFFIIGIFYRGISTYSRGGFISAGVLGLISFWRSPKKMRYVAATVILLAIVFSAMPSKFWQRMYTIQLSPENMDSSARGRIYFWSVAAKMANSNPLTGVGFNGFRPSFAKYDAMGGQFGSDRAVHSAWFGVLAEMGYPGLIFFVTIMCIGLHSCWIILRPEPQSNASQEIKLYANNLQTSLLVFAAGATFLNGQYSEMFWHFIGLSVALRRIDSSACKEGRPESQSAPLERSGILAETNAIVPVASE